MFRTLKSIFPSLILIIFISGILVLTDLESTVNQGPEKKRKVAVFKFSSREALDETERGYLEALSPAWYQNAGNIEITRYNAENDLPTAHTIATDILNSGFDMVITASTPALQVMAHANDQGKIIHIFGTVTDPYLSGVGLYRDKPATRPPWLAGAGSFQPVERAFLIAKMMNPGLKTVGVVWCNGETCSEACVTLGRKICDSLGIKLLENTVDNSTGVYEAAKALISRGIDAIWLGGDNTVEIAAGMLIKAGDEGNVPVFTNNTLHPAMGAIFGVGANYYEVGLAVGKIACEILDGAKPLDFPINNIVPEKLIINGQKMERFRNKSWQINLDIKAVADTIL